MQARLSPRVYGSRDQKAIRKFNITVGVRKNKKAGSDEEKAGGGKRAVPVFKGVLHAPSSPRWDTDARSSPASRGAAVQMGHGGTARTPEAEWSSGIAAFWGGCHNQDIFKDPKNTSLPRR